MLKPSKHSPSALSLTGTLPSAHHQHPLPMASNNRTIPSYAVNMITSAPSLNKDNYHSWKDNMHMFFIGVGADYLLEEGDVVPEDKKELDKHLVLIIWSKVESEHHHILSGSKSALDSWRKIVKHFQKSTMARRLKARRTFTMLFMIHPSQLMFTSMPWRRRARLSKILAAQLTKPKPWMFFL